MSHRYHNADDLSNCVENLETNGYRVLTPYAYDKIIEGLNIMAELAVSLPDDLQVPGRLVPLFRNYLDSLETDGSACTRKPSSNQFFEEKILPVAKEIADDITKTHLWPALRKIGFPNPEDYHVVWDERSVEFDPAMYDTTDICDNTPTEEDYRWFSQSEKDRMDDEARERRYRDEAAEEQAKGRDV